VAWEALLDALDEARGALGRLLAQKRGVAHQHHAPLDVEEGQRVALNLTQDVRRRSLPALQHYGPHLQLLAGNDPLRESPGQLGAAEVILAVEEDHARDVTGPEARPQLRQVGIGRIRRTGGSATPLAHP